VTAPSGRSLTFTYTGSHISSVTDPLGRVTTFTYDENGNLIGSTNALGRSWSFIYDPNHLLLSMADPRGGTTTNTYDSSSRVTAQVDASGRQMTWAYSGDPTSPAGSTTTMTDGRGNITIYNYANLELMSTTHGAGTPAEATTRYQYDPATLGRTSIIDPDGNVTTHTYDAHGNLTSTTNPLGRTTSYYYDSLDDLVYVIDPRSTPTSYTYDSSGNLLSKSAYLTETGQEAKTTYEYGAAPGVITAITDPDGHTTTYTYDNAGDRTSMTDPDGNITTFTYNEDGELTAKVAPAGNSSGGHSVAHTTSYAYDAGGELVSETDPLGHTATFTYDGDGNRVSITDANGHTTQQTYDPNNELTQVTRPDGSILKTQWDQAGNMLAQIDGAGHITSYSYDPLNRLASVTDPDGHTTSYSYDPAGRKIAMVNAEGQTTGYFYDAAGELTGIAYADGKTANVSESYNADGNRTELIDGSGTSSYIYDSLNRMTSATDGSGAIVKYEYDLAGHLTTMTYPNGQTVNRGYDSAGNLTSVTDWLGHTTHFSYDANSNLTGNEYPNGVNGSLTYDNANRVASIADTNGGSTLASFNYGRDAVGQVVDETTNNGGQSTVSYTRNALDQLTAGNQAPYGYDVADNPTTFGSGTTQTFDPASELVSSTTPSTPSENPGENPHEGPNEHPNELPKPPIPPGGGERVTGNPGPHTNGGVEGFHASKASPAIDTVVTATRKKSGSKLISPKLRTHGSHDLVLAFISASKGQRVTHVSGDGLRWSLIARNDGAGGGAEVWQAHASRKLRGPVTVQLPSSGPAGITVTAFGGSSPYVEAHASSQGHASTPTTQLGAPSGSLLWAVGHSSGQKSPTTPSAGQRLVSQFFDRRAHASGWVQQTTASSSASARIADTASVGHWSLVAIAIASRQAHTATASQAQHLRVASPSPTIQDGPGSGTLVSPNPVRSATSSPSGSVTHQFTYNARGDRIAEATPGAAMLTLSYDQADRLVGVGNTASYAYNGDGLRISKTVNGASTQFVWNQAEVMPALLQDGATYYIYGPNRTPIEQISGSTPTYLHQDEQGSTRLLTDASGNVVGRYNYDPWGNVTSHTGSASTNLQYDGQYTDAETGYQYLRARYYDPATGQFLIADPVYKQTRSRYTFASNSPTDFSDPLGLFAVGTCASVSGTVVGGGGASGNAEVCNWQGYFPSFTATTVTGNIGVGLGLDAGVSGQVHVVYSQASSPEGLAGPDCSAGVSGHVIVGVGLSAGGCSGSFSLDLSLDAGAEGGASVTGGVSQTCVTDSSTGYVGCGSSGGGGNSLAPGSSHIVCNDLAYPPYGNFA
jgi:RHS repeat-associated protein